MNLATSTLAVSKKSSQSTPISDPVLLGVGALVLGYVIGSGKWQWLGQNLGKVAQDMGNMSLQYLVESFQKKNPDLFSNKKS
jgi:hypothetical protein